MELGYRYRLSLTKKQHAAMELMLEDQRLLYNAALEERISAYQKAGITINFTAQCRSLTVCRRDLPGMANQFRSMQEATLSRLDRAFSSFFRRLKAGQTPGFPRFKSRARWNTFDVRVKDGLGIRRNRITFKGIPGALRFNEHRPLPRNGKVTYVYFSRDAKGWYVGIIAETPTSPAHASSSEIGVDVGIKSFATLSDGSVIENPRIGERHRKELRRRRKALSRCKRDSRRREKVRKRLARAHLKIANTRSTFLHQVSARLSAQHAVIAVENLNVKGLARSFDGFTVHDVAWFKFKTNLRYKAEKAGGRVIEVDPRFTSQDCSGCGGRVPKPLSQREHSCPSCGLVLDRDHNAALNILHKAKSSLEAGNVAQWSERRPVNIGGNNPRDDFKSGEGTPSPTTDQVRG